MKLKVLYFVDRLLLGGGIQTFIKEVIDRMDKKRIQIDLLLLDDGNLYDMERELMDNDIKVYKLSNIWLRHVWDYIAYFREIDKFYSSHPGYDVVHLHSSSKNWPVLCYAKKHKIPIRIAHAHNTAFQTQSKAQIYVGRFFKTLLQYYATDYFACSKDAGRWLFGKNKTVTVIPNGVNVEKYAYNKEIRGKIRVVLGIKEHETIIGHVGRFVPQKNHEFLIEIFAEYQKLHKDAKLLLVGEGPLKAGIEQKAKDLGIGNYVIFAGFHANVWDYMNAMDYFVLPSRYEGLGLVLVEAQANGLPCFAAEKNVPAEAKVSKQLYFINQRSTAMEWAQCLEKQKPDRADTAEDIRKSGYDISSTAKKLEKYYTRKQ